MRTLLSFLKKEWLEHIRSGRLLLLGMIFVLLGIMNPAVAKLTPWLFEVMADSLAESGMIVTDVSVSAMDSWLQFYKNVPMGLIVFVLLESSIFTKEYQSGSLILALTKGLQRYKVVVSKAIVLVLSWTIGYWCCFGITYGYNAYFWENSVAENLVFSVVCWWIFGLWTISLMVFFSTFSETNAGVLCGTGGVVLGFYLIGLLPKVKKYVPTRLMDGNSLIYGAAEKEAYLMAIGIATLLCLICFVLSILIFNKKKL